MDLFTNIISELWDELGRGTPSFSNDGSIKLDVDDVAYTLSPDITSQKLLISVEVSALSRDHLEQAAQITKILESNLRHLSISTAVVSIHENIYGNTQVALQKLINLRYISLRELTEEIDKLIIHYKNLLKIFNREELSSLPKENKVENDKINLIFNI